MVQTILGISLLLDTKVCISYIQLPNSFLGVFFARHFENLVRTPSSENNEILEDVVPCLKFILVPQP